jgi:hypothetical protein
LRLAHLAQAIITQTHGHQNLIRDPAHLKLELDTLVFQPSPNRICSDSFDRYGYFGLWAHLPSLPKNESGFAAYDSLFILDFVRKLLKFLHMAV